MHIHALSIHFKTATYVGLGRIAPTDYYDGEDG